MRKELEAIEKIERYLKNQLSEVDKEAFEKQMEQDPKLREEVNIQREIMQGIGRVVLKQQIKNAYKKYMLHKALIKIGLITATVVCVGLAILYFHFKNESHSKYGNEELKNQEINESANAYQLLPSQKFTINASKDTVIETDGGITFAIPANCFLDESGKPVEGNVDFDVREALDASSIMQAGLTTMSDSKQLETAGMFYINAKKNSSPLKIDPSKSIYTEVPSIQEKRGDMQLFDGAVTNEGNINWVNPQPIENFLTPVDILSLNFYPPGYLDSLRKWGYNEKDKRFTDSLYYSFAYLFNNQEIVNEGIEHVETEVSDTIQLTEQPNRIFERDSFYKIKGINPSKIKAIWNKNFLNTLIATREFEQRLKLIHKSCDNNLLDLYINKIGERLSHIDSMAAEQSTGEIRKGFLAFASRNEGRVKLNSTVMKKLGEYYSMKVKAFTEAAAKTENEYWRKQMLLEHKANVKKSTHSREDIKRESENLQKEYDINLTEACRQLGIKKPKPLTGNSVYGVPITTTGWKNLDAFVLESTINRTTLDYTDKNGKKAVIKYLPITISINDYKKFDRLYVYMLSDKLNSFMRFKQEGNKFDEKLNELMNYKIICLGYIGDSTYIYEINEAQPKIYNSIELGYIEKNVLTKKLNGINNKGQSEGMIKELDYWEIEINEVKRKKLVNDNLMLKRKIIQVVLPCYHMEMILPDDIK
jgi:hypothetical protein